MQFQKLAFIFPLLAAAVSLLPSPAQATAISFGGASSATNGMWSSVANTSSVDLQGGSSAGYTMSGGAIHSGDHIDYYLAPKNFKGGYESVAFGQSEIDFTSAVKYFGLYWGSIDMYNSISLISGKTVQTYSGAQIAAMFTAQTGKGVQFGDTAMYVNFAAENGATWNKILLKSNGWSFESANLAYEAAASIKAFADPSVSAVPEPSNIITMLAGVGLIAGVLARKRDFSSLAA